MHLIRKLRDIWNVVDRIPVLQFCVGAILGSFSGDLRNCAVLLGIAVLWVTVRQWKGIGLSLGLLVILVQFLVIQTQSVPEDHISHSNGKTVNIVAVVTHDISIKEEKISVVMDVIGLCTDWEGGICARWTPRSGKVQVWLEKYPPVRLGDVWVLSGELREPQDQVGDFSYSDYLSQKDVYSVMYRGTFERTGKRKGFIPALVFWDFGDLLRGKIERSLPEPHASLLAGMLFGFRSSQFPDFSRDLQRTGVTHVIAASGYNVTVVMNFISSLTSVLHRRLKLVASLIAVWCFAFVAGGSIPVIRAALMSSYTVIAQLLGYPSSAHVSFWLSMAVIICLNPEVVSDVSFQLSYASTAGLIYLVPVVERIVPDILKTISDNAVVTFSAICATLPLSLVHFGAFSSVALVVNVIVLPLVAPAMGIGAVSLSIPTSLGIISRIVSVIAWVPLDVFTRVVHFFSSLSFASIESGVIPVWIAIMLYFALFLVIVLFSPSVTSATGFDDIRK